MTEPNSRTMNAQAQMGKDLVYLTVYPEDYNPDLEYPIIVMLHGLGASMYDLANLAPVIESKGYLYVCPNAPIPIQVGQGVLAFSWNIPGGTDPEQTRRCEEKLEGFFEELLELYPLAKGKCLLLGFSQGGGLTYKFGLPNPDIFAGLAALSCSIRDPDALKERLPTNKDQSIFIAHGLDDNPDRARASRDFLESEGYRPSYNEYQMGHEINQDVLSDLVPWMHKVLPPLESAKE